MLYRRYVLQRIFLKSRPSIQMHLTFTSSIGSIKYQMWGRRNNRRSRSTSQTDPNRKGALSLHSSDCLYHIPAKSEQEYQWQQVVPECVLLMSWIIFQLLVVPVLLNPLLCYPCNVIHVTQLIYHSNHSHWTVLLENGWIMTQERETLLMVTTEYCPIKQVVVSLMSIIPTFSY